MVPEMGEGYGRRAGFKRLVLRLAGRGSKRRLSAFARFHADDAASGV